MSSLCDRSAFDDQFETGASSLLPPVADALSLAINHDEPEPWDRYAALDTTDVDQIAEWERWFEEYLRERNR